MELTLKATNQRVLEKVERDFQWYNSYEQEMWYGRGGEMRFRYDPIRKYSVPYLVDAKDWITRNNFGEIEQWVKAKKLPVINSARNIFVTVEITDDELEDLASELYIKKILFDWE